MGNDKSTANGRSITGAVNSSTGARKSRRTKTNANGGQVSARPGKFPPGLSTVRGCPPVQDGPVDGCPDQLTTDPLGEWNEELAKANEYWATASKDWVIPGPWEVPEW